MLRDRQNPISLDQAGGCCSAIDERDQLHERPPTGSLEVSGWPQVCAPQGLDCCPWQAASAAGCNLPSLPAAAGRVRAASTGEHVCDKSTSQWTAGHKHPRQPPRRIRRPGLTRLARLAQLPDPRPARRPGLTRLARLAQLPDPRPARRPGLTRLARPAQLPDPRPARRPTRQRPPIDTDSPRKSEEPPTSPCACRRRLAPPPRREW